MIIERVRARAQLTSARRQRTTAHIILSNNEIRKIIVISSARVRVRVHFPSISFQCARVGELLCGSYSALNHNSAHHGELKNTCFSADEQPSEQRPNRSTTCNYRREHINANAHTCECMMMCTCTHHHQWTTFWNTHLRPRTRAANVCTQRAVPSAPVPAACLRFSSIRFRSEFGL